MNLNSLPNIKHHDANGYEIALCVYGHPYYWLAGGSRGEPKPPAKAGIWRCADCCLPLPGVTETKTLEELMASERIATI